MQCLGVSFKANDQLAQAVPAIYDASSEIQLTRKIYLLMKRLTSLEICAGAGGQALGLEMAGFHHLALVEIDKHACATLRLNRPEWNVIEGDLAKFDGLPFEGVDLLAGGVPCPPFSKAGKQLGAADERNMFPEALRLVEECRPRAVMLENVTGLMGAGFQEYRGAINTELRQLGYEPDWRILNASDYGVSQLRPRVILVAIRKDFASYFCWPVPDVHRPPTVGEILYPQMASRGWRGAKKWAERANDIAPTIVGGSKKHGGPDLGPTRAKQAWAVLGVDGMGIANEPPAPDFVGMPKLTVPMVAKLQGFPDDWQFAGLKTASYRQVGNAFPPPVAWAVGERLAACLTVYKMLQKGA
jgi:DNA (cytosine-5)-methyltransferase 1